MSYFALKHLHMSFAALSGLLFLVRGLMMLRAPDTLPPRNVMVDRGSYVIDTILLGSALALSAWSAQYPFVMPWLTMKVIAILFYIVAGAIALRRGRTRRIRSIAFVAALLIFGYVVKLALTKQVF